MLQANFRRHLAGEQDVTREQQTGFALRACARRRIGWLLRARKVLPRYREQNSERATNNI
jgi:hypothetical protein